MKHLNLNSNGYTISEEIANSITHAIGIALGIVAVVLFSVFATKQHNAWKAVSGILFGGSIIVLYLSSTLYHSIQIERLRRFFKTLDHSSIYLLIAGTYTPFCLVTIHGGWGWSIFGVIWGLAITGLIFKLFFVYRFNTLSTFLYVAMGWIAVIAIKPIVNNLSLPGIEWLFAGGLFYTFGIIFYLADNRRFNHAIWHLFVLAGTLCHFFAVLYYVILSK